MLLCWQGLLAGALQANKQPEAIVNAAPPPEPASAVRSSSARQARAHANVANAPPPDPASAVVANRTADDWLEGDVPPPAERHITEKTYQEVVRREWAQWWKRVVPSARQRALDDGVAVDDLLPLPGREYWKPINQSSEDYEAFTEIVVRT